MATLQLISSRLRSVKNIQKITKSMKMVSAAKYARAERELLGARPHGEGTQIFFDRTQVAKAVVLEPKVDEGEKLIIAISSDRGLCGAIHTQIAKAVRSELGATPGKTKIVCVGDRMRSLLQYSYKENIVLSVNEIGRLPPTFLDASKIAMSILKISFTEGKIYFNKFVNIASNKVSNIPIFAEAEILKAPNATLYEEMESEVLDDYLEFAFVSLVYFTMKENACSEQASRMTAMDNATKNAGDMISKLQLTYNRTRQAVITKELIEIISGAAALK